MREVKIGTVRVLCALMIAVALLPGCKNRAENNATQTTAAAPTESATTLLFIMLTDPETTTETTTQTTTETTTKATTQTTTQATTQTTTNLVTTTAKPTVTTVTTTTPTTTLAPSTTSAPTSATTQAPVLPSSAAENVTYYSTEISQVQSLVNRHRSTYGLYPLTLDPQLTLAACIRAREMAKAGDMSHTRPNGKSCFSVFDEVGIKCTTSGENIAFGQSSPEDVFNAWRTSPGHNANMLNGNYQKIGVGVAADSNGRLYWVQLFAKDVEQINSESPSISE